MPNLKHFIINGNEKLKNVRRDIVQCGTPRILKHLRQGFDSEGLHVSPSSSPTPGDVLAPDKCVSQVQFFYHIEKWNFLDNESFH